MMRHDLDAVLPAGSVCCEIRNGLPMLHGKARGHYVSCQGGQRMLVLDRRCGDHIRINDTTELIVLDTQAGEAKIAIELLT